MTTSFEQGTGSYDSLLAGHTPVDFCHKCGRTFWLQDEHMKVNPKNITVNCDCDNE